MIRRAVWFTFAVAAATGVSVVGARRADCKAVPGNLLANVNCGFDKDAAGWKGTTGTAIAHVPEGAGDSASAAMTLTSSAQGGLSASSACVPMRGGTSYQVGARLRLASGTPFFCALNAWQFSDAKCGGVPEPLATNGRPPEKGWHTLQATASTRADAASALLRADCSGQGVVSVMWDDFVIAPASGK